MNCEEIREMLLTDYIDGELDADAALVVKRHLASCGSCRAFEASVREAAVEPFKEAPVVAPPAHIWKGIENAIGRETPARRPFAFPRSVFVAATVAMLIVAAAVVARIRYAEQRDLGLYVAEEMLSLSSLGENGASLYDDEWYGT